MKKNDTPWNVIFTGVKDIGEKRELFFWKWVLNALALFDPPVVKTFSVHSSFFACNEKVLRFLLKKLEVPATKLHKCQRRRNKKFQHTKQKQVLAGMCVWVHGVCVHACVCTNSSLCVCVCVRACLCACVCVCV